MKTVAFVIALLITSVGAIGILAPSSLVWIGQRFTTPLDWFAIGAVRAAFGVLLLSVAKASRAPRTVRVVALIPLAAALKALATPFFGVEHARATIEWWSSQGSGFVRLSALPVLALGVFVAYACAPARRIV